jgi:hypothetical protein
MDQSHKNHLEEKEKELEYDLEKNVKEPYFEENVKEEKTVEEPKEYNFDDELNAQLEANYKEILQEEKKEDSKPIPSEVKVEIEAVPRKKPFWACLPFF